MAGGILVYLGVQLWGLWSDSEVSFGEAEVSVLGIASVASVVAVVSYGCVWPVILRRIGGPVPDGALVIFLQSQLGKYVPGSVWHFAGRVGLARARGVPVRQSLASLGVEVAASALAAALVGTLVLPHSLGAAVAVGLAGMIFAAAALPFTRRFIRRLANHMPIDGFTAAVRTVPRATILYVPVWALFGLALWLTARALFPVPVGDLAYFTGAFALGWLAGMAVVVAPSGIGVREAVLVALLGPRIGHAEALVVAAASRILLTSADLGSGALALVLARSGRRPAEAGLRTGDGRATP